jgi:hypothetical protein
MDPCSAGLWISDGMNTNTESMTRIHVVNPRYQGLFNIFTVLDPTDYGRHPLATRIPGRININTAPWYVIAQLPWMDPNSWSAPDPSEDYWIARAIVRNRDGVGGSFNNIAELTRVGEMYWYAMHPSHVGVDLNALPDLTPGDGAADDFEERYVIFARISNLITVRSDVFTAYILVRIGEEGPQRRMIAILDRSQVRNTGDQVRIRALHPVHDPR